MADIAALQVKRAQLIEKISLVTAALESRRRTLRQAESTLAVTTDPARRGRLEAQISELERDVAAFAGELAGLNRQLAEIDAQIAAAQRQQAAPKQSAGETVRAEQTARAEGASPTNPVPPAQSLAPNEEIVDAATLNRPPSNAQRTATSTTPGSTAQDRGLAAPVRRQSQTQSTPATLPQPGPVQPSASGPQPSATPGAAAAGDDVRASINAIFGGEAATIITQDNVLDKYASYTYSISLYLMSPEDYSRLITTKQKNLAGFNLLIQSAGIPLSTGFGRQPDVADVGETPTNTQSLDAGRNEFFQEDFYIDDVRITSQCSGKGSNGPHNVTELAFKITEPNGISLLPRLHRAAQQYSARNGVAGEVNYAAQNYLMVIRFYGYDPDGNQYLPITGTRNDAQGLALTVPTAIEKFIPFQFSNISFRVANQLTEYNCQAVVPQNIIATSAARGTIPYNVQITSKTLQELLNGPVVFGGTLPAVAPGAAPGANAASPGLGNTFDLELGITPDPSINPVTTVNTAPPKASAAGTPTITQGLALALNKYQADLVTKGVYTIPDNYRIEILTPALQNAKVVPPGEVDQRKTPMGPTAKAPANQQKNPATQSQNKDAGTTSALAGMSILQFIDQYTRTSTYIYDQQTRIIDPKTGKVKLNPSPVEFTAWYRVGLQAVPRRAQGIDPKRGDYAYDITYQLSPYKVNRIESDYFPQGEFVGVHKKYNYWFTGENTQVLKFDLDFNHIYYLTVNTEQPTVETGTTTNYREAYKKAFSPRSAQSAQGQSGATNEASANAADYLYSPSDLAEVSLEILGDPAWLQQGELWAGVAGTGQFYGPFLDDGTINFEGQECLFEVAFNQPVDYNLDTGTMDPGTKNYGANRQQGVAGAATQSYIFRAKTVTSMFSQGRFTQQLEGTIILFELPQPQGGAFLAGPDQSDAETARLARQNQTPPASRGSANTARVQGALGDTGSVNVSGEFGAYFGTGETNGAVNFKPKGLAQVLDGQRAQAPAVAAQPANLTPAPAPTPPTSSGQTVGPAASGTAAIGRLGGASGAAVGEPRVQVFLKAGGTINVISNIEIQRLFDQGLITAQERTQAAQALNIKRQAANSPVNNQPAQLGSRDY